MFHDHSKDPQILRTISLSAADLEWLQNLLRKIAANECSVDENTTNDPPGPQFSVGQDALLGLAKTILSARRRRTQYFKKPLFGEPAWDMLLALYVSQVDGPRHSVGRLSALSGAPPTTALRWLDYLEREQLVARLHNPTDRRSDFIELTDKGRSAMGQYLSETLQFLA